MDCYPWHPFYAINIIHIECINKSDWIRSIDDRRSTKSTRGFVIFLGRNLVSWSAKKQLSVARSYMEAEFCILADAVSKIIWIQKLFKEIGFARVIRSQVWTNNLEAKHLTHNPMFHSHTKHMTINFNFIWELIKKGILQLTHISTRDQLVDGFKSSTIITIFWNKVQARGRILE